MSKEVTITSLSGTQPYDIYLCDNAYNNCIYITSLNNSDIPYSFILPPYFENLSQVGIKAIDHVGCIIKEVVTI